jgi:hypothetical protein
MLRSMLARRLTTTAIGYAASALAGGPWLHRTRPFSLRGKNALVTGGARGLGLEVARVLVRAIASAPSMSS